MKATKKSKSVRLVLLGGASLTLAACDEAPPNDARFFANVQDCAGVYGEATCRDAAQTSEQAFAAEAPKFARKEECEAEFGAGNCETREASAGAGSFFMPMMMGYMLGSAFNRPVYRGPEGSAMTQAGGKFFNVGQFAGAGRTAAFQPAQITQVRRGGFGSTATAFRSTAGS